jgi:hypothetical protein
MYRPPNDGTPFPGTDESLYGEVQLSSKRQGRRQLSFSRRAAEKSLAVGAAERKVIVNRTEFLAR